jgi:hypothetical protein
MKSFGRGRPMIPSLDLEKTRALYRPRRVTSLFVGESPPANGGFFYFGKGILFKSTERAFARVLGRTFASPEDFFDVFQHNGCFLDDLSLVPIDNLRQSERIGALDSCIDSFAERLRTLMPDRIVVFLKRIESAVTRAALLADIPVGKLIVLPFPGNGHQNRYVTELTALLEQAKALGKIGDY